ncbi:MAG: hypothetical protein OES46_05880 [Gammaproteobacteria bacterium]|jgi:regulator of replication initiation timing|nr:hypothetical protein [Gammaproteobacteria bacterium]
MWQLIGKLGPRALVALTATALLLMTGVILYAVRSGHPVSVFGLSIDPSNAELQAEVSALRKRLEQRAAPNQELELQINDLTRKLEERPTMEELDELKSQIAQALTPSDLPGIWDAGMSKDDILTRLRVMKKSIDDYQRLEGSPDFVFLKLEREISNSGGAVNTNIAGENERDVFRLIQTALQFIDAFQGNPDGTQASTNRALEEFQQAHNAKLPKEQQLKPLGFFGRRTLTLIRNKYWKIIQKS